MVDGEVIIRWLSVLNNNDGYKEEEERLPNGTPLSQDQLNMIARSG
jgi:hypothetical protein